MTYRIRYRSKGGACEEEALVEAHSPAEAMVKFQFVQDPGRAARACEFVTSVNPVCGLGAPSL